jgi:hypothetical protein
VDVNPQFLKLQVFECAFFKLQILPRTWNDNFFPILFWRFGERVWASRFGFVHIPDLGYTARGSFAVHDKNGDLGLFVYRHQAFAWYLLGILEGIKFERFVLTCQV